MTFKEPEDEEFDRIEREQSFKQDGYASLTYNLPPNQTTFYSFSPPSKPILTITSEGNVLWRDRLIESDDEFRKAMLDLKEHFDQMNLPYRRPLQRLTRQQVTDIWTTRFPPDGTINADTFVYEFADALQTYLGIGD